VKVCQIQVFRDFSVSDGRVTKQNSLIIHIILNKNSKIVNICCISHSMHCPACFSLSKPYLGTIKDKGKTSNIGINKHHGQVM
jgi:hypothetical protein